MFYCFLNPREAFDQYVVGFVGDQVCYDYGLVFEHLVEQFKCHTGKEEEASQAAAEFFNELLIQYEEEYGNAAPLFLNKRKWQDFCLHYSKTNIVH